MENDLLQIKKNLSALYAYYIIEGGRFVKCEIGYGEKANFYLQLSIAFPEFLVHQWKNESYQDHNEGIC